ncbi:MULTISPECIES: sugar phosphate isomerase/epimerase family protein [unclassified Geodermatophilus]
MLLAALSALLFVGLVGPANAAPSTQSPGSSSDCAGRGVPASKISIQLWTFAEYIGFGSDAATVERLEHVLGELSEMGYRNVEPFTLNGLSAEQYRDLLHEYGLKASARHVDVGTPANPSDIEQILEENRVLGIKYFGSGGTPRLTTEAQWIAYAQYLDTVGEQARKAGQTLMVHNHNWEFETVFGDRTAYDILMTYTDPRNVVFQLDLYWATFAGADPVELIEQYGNRIQLFHVKDMRASDRRIEIVGRGTIEFPEIFAAGGGSTKYFVVEHDPRFGDPTFNPFQAAQEGFAYLACVTY